MTLSVIIVNYNVKYFLEQALLSVRKAAAGMSVEVWVVDNNSVDDSVTMVKEKFPEVKLIENKNNPGFSIANNQAIRQCTGKYVLLLNPDTVVEEDTFSKCVAFMDAHPDAGGLGVKMIDGSGNFLPESKRGFPSAFVAFCKTFGLSKIFPRSKTFNHYHLGYLDKDENHEVEVLAGAFMLLRHSVLDEIGLLDEAFFMYGEDIDLSYRIVKAGYKNYYLSETTIIHYKGESTKKGSLNYVKTFYNAMIIFARKHFTGEKANLYIFMLNLAIYFRAFLTVASNFLKRIYLPVLDAVAIFAGMVVLKNSWATSYYKNPDYYEPSFLYFNIPLYICIWLGAVYFSGGYERQLSLRRLLRGLFFGTLLLAAVYGFLDMAYRSSRVLIVLGAVWAVCITVFIRAVVHFIKYNNLSIGREKIGNLVIVGKEQESKRALAMLHQAQVRMNFIGVVSPEENAKDHPDFLSNISQLDELVHIYKIDEIIFCSSDVSAQSIMHWMTELGPGINYKIIPEESLSIIGSNSKNKAGELYTFEIQFRIARSLERRNKRMLDILLAAGLSLLFPVLLLVKQRSLFFKNIFPVLAGRKHWVAYAGTETHCKDLPKLKPGVLSPLDALKRKSYNEHTIRRLNFLYAKDFQVWDDLEILWKAISGMGRK